MSRRPSRRCPRASGIGHRSRRQADSGGSWPQCIVETWRGCLRNSAKSPPPLRTCRRAFSATADSGKEKRYAMTCPWQHKHNPFHRKVRYTAQHLRSVSEYPSEGPSLSLLKAFLPISSTSTEASFRWTACAFVEYL